MVSQVICTTKRVLIIISLSEFVVQRRSPWMIPYNANNCVGNAIIKSYGVIVSIEDFM